MKELSIILFISLQLSHELLKRFNSSFQTTTVLWWVKLSALRKKTFEPWAASRENSYAHNKGQYQPTRPRSLIMSYVVPAKNYTDLKRNATLLNGKRNVCKTCTKIQPLNGYLNRLFLHIYKVYMQEIVNQVRCTFISTEKKVNLQFLQFRNMHCPAVFNEIRESVMPPIRLFV